MVCARHYALSKILLVSASMLVLAACMGAERECNRPVKFKFWDGLTAAAERDFKRKFCVSVERVNNWWGTAFDGNFTVEVFKSERPSPSMALVPAWEGARGTMRFPSIRLEKRNAAITHELVHVVAPNQNRFLAEGLAVFAQWKLYPTRRVFPNFGEPLHRAGKKFASDADIGFMDSIATPDTLRFADEAENSQNPEREDRHITSDRPTAAKPGGDSARSYIVAGSFVQFLIARYGMSKFREVYDLTPLRVCEEGGGGALERWSDVYEKPLSTLESEWKNFVLGRR